MATARKVYLFIFHSSQKSEESEHFIDASVLIFLVCIYHILMQFSVFFALEKFENSALVNKRSFSEKVEDAKMIENPNDEVFLVAE